MSKPGKELYVGSLSYDTTEYDLEKLFSVSGRVTSIHLITDLKTGEFKGCGYVRMFTEAEAKDAVDSLDGAMLIDRKITVSIANPQKMKAQGGGYRGKSPAAAKASGTAARATSRATSGATSGGASAGSKPAASKGAAAKPAAAKPASSRPAADKPASFKPASSKPGASRSAAEKPAFAKTGFSKPSTAKTGPSRSGKR